MNVQITSKVRSMGAPACSNICTSTRVVRAALSKGSQRDVSSAALSDRTTETSRRAALSAGLGVSLAALFPSTAFALLPDDDDEELIRRAKEKRQNTLRQELAKEKNFIGISKPTEAEIGTVQLAVAKLVKTGSLIEAGNMDDAVSVMGGTAWASDLTALAKRKSAGAASAPAGKMISSLEDLQTAVQNSQTDKAKVSLASTAAALEDFVSAVGMSGSIKGL